MPCRYPGCSAKKYLDNDGFCKNHKLDIDALLNQKEEFKKLHDKLDTVLKEFAEVKKENKELKHELVEIKKENKYIKAKCNTNFFANDAINQYGRKESFRIHKYPEPLDPDVDNSLSAVFAVAKKLNINISKGDIQRCHRVGKRRKNPRSIIVKLKCWSKRMEFIKGKATLRDAKWVINDEIDNNEDGENEVGAEVNGDDDVQENEGNAGRGKKLNIFLTEDLSPFRLKILHYIKDYNNENQKLFDIITTRNGNIVCRTNDAAQVWYTVTSTEDFLKAGIPMKPEFFSELMF